MSEFSMLETRVEENGREELAAVDGPSVLIVTKGGAKMEAGGGAYELKEGSVFFIAHGVEVELDAGEQGLLAHVAFVE
jgi:mannose-6-phosphate isomerase